MKTAIKMINIILLLSIFSCVCAKDSFQLIATMTGEKTGDGFSVVAGIGDVNGDGYDDVLVGAPGGNYAKLYFGGSPYDTVADLKFVCEKPESYFGCSVDGGGDINGDGFSDIVIGARSYAIGNCPCCIASAGKVYVYFGGAEMDTIPDLEIVVGNWDDNTGWYYNFGHSVSFAGDMNKDGYDDLIVGAPNDDYDAHGRAYIYFGGAEMDSIADVLIEGEESADMLGWSVSDAGDVNGDGFDDVIIGAPQMLAQNNIGKSYLIYGGNEIGLTHSEVFVGDTTKRAYGRWVSGLGDVNGDGFDDFGIMADDYFKVISGKTLEPLSEILEKAEWDNFQYISDCGDLNSDGYYDILIGIADSDSLYAGKAAIYLGNTNLDTIPNYEIMGETPHYYFASSVDYAGDINNDGHKDIIIGERAYSGPYGPIGYGKVYIYSFGIIDRVEDTKNPIYREKINLNQNYPNPFNLSTTITYDLSYPSYVVLEIFNCTGQKIKTLLSKKQEGGSYRIVWDGADEKGISVSSGIYFYKVSLHSLGIIKNTYTQVKKLVLLK